MRLDRRKAALQINSILQLERNPLAQSLWGNARLRCVLAGNRSDSNAAVAPGLVCALACVRLLHPLVLLVEAEHDAPHDPITCGFVTRHDPACYQYCRHAGQSWSGAMSRLCCTT